MKWTNRGRFPAKERDFSFVQSPERFWGPHIFSCSAGRETVSSGVNWPLREVCHSPPPTAGLRNECNYTSSPSIRLHGVDMGEITFVWRPANSGTAFQVRTKSLLKHPFLFFLHISLNCSMLQTLRCSQHLKQIISNAGQWKVCGRSFTHFSVIKTNIYYQECGIGQKLSK